MSGAYITNVSLWFVIFFFIFLPKFTSIKTMENKYIIQENTTMSFKTFKVVCGYEINL